MKQFPAALAVALLGAAGFARAEIIFGIDVSNRLCSFYSDNPESPTFLNGGAPVSGLQPNESLLAIDFSSPNPSSRTTLYGLGSSNRLYAIDTVTAAATPIGSPGAFTLDGNDFGMDYHPGTGLLGVVRDLGQNIRLNPFDGTLLATDSNLAYAAGDSGFGLAPRIAGAAFSNNRQGQGCATLFGIDFGRDVLVRQGGLNGDPPPTGGQLITIGALGLDFTGEVGFDISGIGFNILCPGGPYGSGAAYVSLSPVTGPQDPSSALYVIDLATAQITRLGSIGPAGGVCVRHA
jgi:hypothetical protein